MQKASGQRLAQKVLGCGVQVVVYRLRGARSTCAVLRVPAWSSIFPASAPAWMLPHSDASGHLLEHVISAVLAERGSDLVDLGGPQGLWKGESAEWLVEGTPGDLGRMLRLLASLPKQPIPIDTEAVQAAWSTMRLEAHHFRNAPSWHFVHQLLSGEDDSPPLPDAVDIKLWTAALQRISTAWLHPERMQLLIVGPHHPSQVITKTCQAFSGLPEHSPILESQLYKTEAPTPKQMIHQYRGVDPVPTVYAWVVPYLHAYRGALALFVKTAHDVLQRLSNQIGLSYVRAVGPAANHVWGVVWCEPNRVDEALALVRCAFLTSLEQLSDPVHLRTLKQRLARAEYARRASSPRSVASGYVWMRRMFPNATDPFSEFLREIMAIDVEDIYSIRRRYEAESLLTTVTYRS